MALDFPTPPVIIHGSALHDIWEYNGIYWWIYASSQYKLEAGGLSVTTIGSVEYQRCPVSPFYTALIAAALAFLPTRGKSDWEKEGGTHEPPSNPEAEIVEISQEFTKGVALKYQGNNFVGKYRFPITQGMLSVQKVGGGRIRELNEFDFVKGITRLRI